MTPRLLAALVAAALAAAVVAGAPVPAVAATPPPHISAGSAILVQPDTQDVPFRRASTKRRLIASTTKLMTALLTLERAPLRRTVTAVPYAAAPAESLMGLHGGEKVTIHDLLVGLLLASGNDAATTLAVRVGGSEAAFVRAMNRRARQLGLTDTHYSNPVGLDSPRNYSSAQDLAKLALVLMEKPFFARTVDRRSESVTSGGRTRTLVNRNTLVQEVPWVDGVKTGHTNRAGYVLVGSARQAGVRLVSVVVDDPSEAARDADSLALLRWGLRQYKRTEAVRRGAVLARPRLDHRDERADVVAARSVRLVVRRGERAQVRVTGVPAELTGPLPKGRRVGTAIVSRAGRRVAEIPLVTADAVPAAGLAAKVSSALPSAWLIALAAVVVACSLSLALRHRRRVRRRRARARRRGGAETA